MSGERPVTVRGPEEGDRGREEGEGEQERVYLVMTPFWWMTGGADQENTTSLSPVTAVKFCGAPDGAERERRRGGGGVGEGGVFGAQYISYPQ